uniref:Uncharacterized protein n=1 Tax=Cucumis melo TaxID=3656 RepID=A0A9I9EGR8_CUCME
MYMREYICGADLLLMNFYMEVYAGISGILVCIAGEIVIRFVIE